MIRTRKSCHINKTFYPKSVGLPPEQRCRKRTCDAPVNSNHVTPKPNNFK